VVPFSRRYAEHAIQVLDDVYVSTNRESLRKLLDRDKPMEGLRISSATRAWRLISLRSK
jgi:hypothetical protein